MLSRTLRQIGSKSVLTNLPKYSFHSSKPLNEIMTVRDTIRIAMSDEMRRDKNVFLMGEEVGVY
jgi:hypothetical protein